MIPIEKILSEYSPDCANAPWYPRKDLLEDFDRSGRDYRPFLDPSAVRENALWAALPGEWEESLLRGARMIRENPSLLRLFCLVSDLLIREEERYKGDQFRYWPDPEKEMGEEASVFFLLVMLNAIPLVREGHQDRGIPLSVTQDTCAGIGTKARDYFFHYDRPGVLKWTLWWVRHHLSGRLYRVGRLEYMIKRPYNALRAYRKEETGAVRVLMNSPEDGAPIAVGPDGSFESAASLDPAGGEALCLTQEDYVLDVHIPGGGKLTLETIKDSFVRALAFFDAFFPEKPAKAFECISWILSRDLEGFMDPSSNLIRFRDQTYLFPVKTDRVDGYYFVFGTFSTDPENWAEKTSVQRRLKEYLRKGGALRMAGMIYLREDLERFGEFPYRE